MSDPRPANSAIPRETAGIIRKTVLHGARKDSAAPAFMSTTWKKTAKNHAICVNQTNLTAMQCLLTSNKWTNKLG